MLGDAISVSVQIKRILSRIEVVNKTKLLEYVLQKSTILAFVLQNLMFNSMCYLRFFIYTLHQMFSVYEENYLKIVFGN